MSMVSLTLKLLTVATYLLRKDGEHRLNANQAVTAQEYDFIVIGSGSAGGVVAARLVESNIRVLLLEAGGADGVPNDIPAEFPTNLKSDNDWVYNNIPLPVGIAFLNGTIYEPRGKVLGGSSSINAMIYVRGNRHTYDGWARDYDAQGWSYKDVLPYFKKFENNTDPTIVANGYHGTKGPVQITSSPDPIDPFILLQRKALNKLGIMTTDINGPVQTGTAISQSYINTKGVRSSISNSYLNPNPNPKRLDIITRAFVTKILFNGLTATGVEFDRYGQRFTVKARREVIVSAGAINSPQLLMLSGVGPRDQLKQWGIPVVADLPVGQHLQNHPVINLYLLIKEQFVKDLVINDLGNTLTIDALYEYYVNGTGQLARFYNTMTYLNTKSNQAKTDFPNGAFHSTTKLFVPDLSKLANLLDFGDLNKEWQKYYGDFYGKPYISILPTLVRPKSCGYVRLQSDDPYVYPIINSNFLDHPQDFEDLVDIIKFVFHVFERSSISVYLKRHKPIPGCQSCPGQRYTYECDQYIRCLIKQVTNSIYHFVGTNRMGAAHRTDIVVDTRLRVKGIEGLRVCDASIMPTIPNGNTNAASIMIGEKCADIVKQDNRLTTDG